MLIFYAVCYRISTNAVFHIIRSPACHNTPPWRWLTVVSTSNKEVEKAGASFFVFGL